ncbi:MAG: hypothetical protein ACXVXP_00310 [Mycobacteriaceae bacterium]
MTALRDTLAELLAGTPGEDPNVLTIPGPAIVRCSITGGIYVTDSRGHRKVATVADGAARIAAEVRLAVSAA